MPSARNSASSCLRPAPERGSQKNGDEGKTYKKKLMSSSGGGKRKSGSQSFSSKGIYTTIRRDCVGKAEGEETRQD